MTLALLAMTMTACGMATPIPDFNSFAHRVTDDTIVLYWNCSRPTPGVLRVAGVADNLYSPVALQDLEFRLYGVNAQGVNVSWTRGSAQAFQIYTNQPSPFTLDLKTATDEVRYDLVYRYLLPIEGQEAILMGGERQNYAQDICAGLGP